MADWSTSVLRNSGREFLSLYGQDVASSYRQMMDSDSAFSTEKTDENTFCTPDNVRDCIAFLNQELSVLGFQRLSYDESETALVNRLYEILRLYQRTGRAREELENRIHRISGELEHYQTLNIRLKTEREKLEREVAKEQEKNRQIITKHKSLSVKFKSEKDEVKRLQSIIKDRDVQYKHELKKKERELNKLKEKLHQLIADKTPNRRVGLDIANSLQRTDGRRSQWKTHDKQEEMYQMVIHNYEDKQRELMLENTDLRDLLLQMQRDLISVSSHSDHSISNNISPNTSHSSEDDENLFTVSSRNIGDNLSEGYFQMPYNLMRENLQKSFKETCKRIKENLSVPSRIANQGIKLKNSPPKTTASRIEVKTKEEIDKLHKQISRYKEIVQQQEELIQQSLQTNTKSMEDSFLHESVLLQEKESLAEQWRMFYQEKANFEGERRRCTETAIKLGRERKAIEDEKASLLKDQFLQISPFKKTPSKTRSHQKAGEGTRLLPSTPMFSPAPSVKVKTPTTVELYRLLGLTPKDIARKKEEDIAKGDNLKLKLKKTGSSESLFSNCVSCNSAPTQSESSVSFSAKRTLFNRRSSTGSNEDLDV